jgi:hypothetical protein
LISTDLQLEIAPSLELQIACQSASDLLENDINQQEMQRS